MKATTLYLVKTNFKLNKQKTNNHYHYYLLWLTWENCSTNSFMAQVMMEGASSVAAFGGQLCQIASPAAVIAEGKAWKFKILKLFQW